MIQTSTIKRIHVNQHIIKSNAKNGKCEPALAVKTTRANKKCHEVIIHGKSRVIYSPNKPLSCGARVWIETHAVVDSVVNDGPVLRIVEEVK